MAQMWREAKIWLIVGTTNNCIFAVSHYSAIVFGILFGLSSFVIIAFCIILMKLKKKANVKQTKEDSEKKVEIKASTNKYESTSKIIDLYGQLLASKIICIDVTNWDDVLPI